MAKHERLWTNVRFAIPEKRSGQFVGVICAIATAAVLNAMPSGAAHAALLCTNGTVIGIGSCAETVSFTAGLEITNGPLTLDKWTSNAAAGLTETLTNVQYRVGGNVNFSGSVTNNGPALSAMSFSQSEAITFTSGPGSPGNFLTAPMIANGSSTPVPPVNVSPGTNLSLSGNYTVGPSSPVNVNTSLGQYIGPGTFQAQASTSTGSILTSTTSINGGNAGPVATSALGQIQIEYDFQNAASSGALAGPGGGGFICTPGNVAGAGSCVRTISFGPAATDFTNALSLDKFQSNAAAGFSETLTHARFTLSDNVHSDGSLMNDTSGTATIGLGVSNAMTFSAGSGAPSGFLTSPVVVTSNGTVSSGTLASGASTPYTLDFAGSPTALDLTAGLSGFLGVGTFDANMSTSTSASVAEALTATGADVLGNTTSISPFLTLTYTFDNERTSVASSPEPASISILGVAFALTCLGASRRRRRASRRR